jgi:PTS HPr component family protein
MTDRSLEEVIQERAFSGLLRTRAESFLRLSNTLLARADKDWHKKHFYPLMSEAEDLESFLDDYGARFNRTYGYLRELVASVRWFAMTGFSLAHLESRIESYSVRSTLSEAEAEDAENSQRIARDFVRNTCVALLRAVCAETDQLGLEVSPEKFPEHNFAGGTVRQRLPRNVGQQDLVDEATRIAEVATKYLSACAMLEDLCIRRIKNVQDRKSFLARICSEEQARVYEATVHNLQSTYDTYIKNTVLEGRDERLPRLRGHLSAALHLLESVTFLTHFVERHESGVRNEAAELKIAKLVDRSQVQDTILNQLLEWAYQFMRRGRPLAEDLLAAYTNVQELTVELPEDLKLHARPAALIVGIVENHRTPVELEIAGKRCNAGSILDLLVTVGSHPDARRYVFRGDVKPLRDIALLFQHGLGENGIESLPRELQYLKS